MDAQLWVRDIKVEGWASPADQDEKLVARASRPRYLRFFTFMSCTLAGPCSYFKKGT